MREEIKDLAKRIDESFRQIQDLGLTTLLEKDTSPISLDHYSTSSSQPPNQEFQRQGMHVGLLPASLTKFESKGILRVENANLTSNAMFHAFHDILAVSDDRGVGIWSLENGTQIMHLRASATTVGAQVLEPTVSSPGRNGKSSAASNTSNSPKGPLITSMSWVNESLDSLVLVGCDDGTVKIWRDVGDGIEDSMKVMNEGYASPESLTSATSGVVLASAFKALPDISGGAVGSGMVLSWQQSSGLLSVGGNSGTVRLWDVSQEKCVTVFQTGVDTCLTTLISQTASFQNKVGESSWGAGIVNSANAAPSSNNSLFAWSFAGFADGSIGIYDQRVDTRGGRVHLAKEHNSWIVSAHLRADIPEVLSCLSSLLFFPQITPVARRLSQEPCLVG
jgi:WD40 repeat protein